MTEKDINYPYSTLVPRGLNPEGGAFNHFLISYVSQRLGSLSHKELVDTKLNSKGLVIINGRTGF